MAPTTTSPSSSSPSPSDSASFATASTGTDGYGSIETARTFESLSSSSDEEEASLLEDQRGSRKSKTTTKKNKKALERTVADRASVRRRSFAVILGLLLVAGGAVVFFGRVPERSRDGDHHRRSPSRRSSNRLSSSETKTTTKEPRRFDRSDLEAASSFGISPVDDMEMLSLERAEDALPSAVWGNHLHRTGHPLPTNSWYLNLVSRKAANSADGQTRAYSVPYIVDTMSPKDGLDGLRIHWPYRQASESNVQMVDDESNMLFLGATGIVAGGGKSSRYRVRDGPLSNLGVGLEWTDGNDGDVGGDDGDDKSPVVMETHIVRGMAYATMEYPAASAKAIPTIYGSRGLASDLQIDRESPFEPVTSSSGDGGGLCGNTTQSSVRSHLHLHFTGSDFTWMVFFSKPVKISCAPTNDYFHMSIHENDDGYDDTSTSNTNSNLVVRVAMLNECTTGQGSVQAHCENSSVVTTDRGGYEKLLKAGAHVVPRSPTIDFDYSTASAGEGDRATKLRIDWNASSVSEGNSEPSDLLMFALPHHQETLSEAVVTDQCVGTFHGSTCLVQNSTWVLEEALGAPLSFFAPRPPTADLVPDIAKALNDDISFELGDYLLNGAADTYFSGKVLSRLARVLVIAEELATLKGASSAKDVSHLYTGSVGEDSAAVEKLLEESIRAAAGADLPSEEARAKALDQLRTAVTVWLRSNAEAPYLYDESWGGLVNCGCRSDGKSCTNTFPDCPALEKQEEDFGNGYYNDHHYHYGYHVYAAAVVARLDPEWGRTRFDDIMLYVRDFANPRDDDKFFPQYRHKDWFLGSSWASGIVSAENSPHGRNEESSSEAIAAYEGVALYGAAMVEAFAGVASETAKAASGLATAELIRDSGQLLTASEIAATNRYWHVWSSDKHDNTYPEEYKQPVVGMLYDTMATIQTWFSSSNLMSYGIQLIPLTPVAETRDDPDWATELYPLYEEACAEAGDACTGYGWDVLQAGLLATTGDRAGAAERAKAVIPGTYETDTSGNTMTNTLWYIATRRDVPA